MELTPVGDVVKVKEEDLLVGGQRSGFPGRGQDRSLRGELLIEVADVVGALNGRNERWLHLLGQQPVPIHVLVDRREQQRRGSLKRLGFVSIAGVFPSYPEE